MKKSTSPDWLVLQYLNDANKVDKVKERSGWNATPGPILSFSNLVVGLTSYAHQIQMIFSCPPPPVPHRDAAYNYLYYWLAIQGCPILASSVPHCFGLAGQAVGWITLNSFLFIFKLVVFSMRRIIMNAETNGGFELEKPLRSASHERKALK